LFFRRFLLAGNLPALHLLFNDFRYGSHSVEPPFIVPKLAFQILNGDHFALNRMNSIDAAAAIRQRRVFVLGNRSNSVLIKRPV
ncbi:MAG: hypothetical protein PVF71_04785, partial [Desulfobacterales bacterium]